MPSKTSKVVTTRAAVTCSAQLANESNRLLKLPGEL